MVRKSYEERTQLLEFFIPLLKLSGFVTQKPLRELTQLFLDVFQQLSRKGSWRGWGGDQNQKTQKLLKILVTGFLGWKIQEFFYSSFSNFGQESRELSQAKS